MEWNETKHSHRFNYFGFAHGLFGILTKDEMKVHSNRNYRPSALQYRWTIRKNAMQCIYLHAAFVVSFFYQMFAIKKNIEFHGGTVINVV